MYEVYQGGSGFYVVSSLQSLTGTFASYKEGWKEAGRLNLEKVIADGIADDLMPNLDGGKTSGPRTYREYYESVL